MSYGKGGSWELNAMYSKEIVRIEKTESVLESLRHSVTKYNGKLASKKQVKFFVDTFQLEDWFKGVYKELNVEIDHVILMLEKGIDKDNCQGEPLLFVIHIDEVWNKYTIKEVYSGFWTKDNEIKIKEKIWKVK